MTWITGNPMWDALGSVCIGVLLILIAIFIGIEVKALLIGQGVEPLTRTKMLTFLEERAEIEKVFNLLTLQMGNDVVVAIKAKMTDHESPEEMIRAINKCETAFRETFPETMWLFFEPDNKD
jgi:divalent metal cation (Fe/Co/Zn/Cd) transporter